MYWVSFEQEWTWQPAASGGWVSWTVFVCLPFSACVFYLKWSVIVCSLTRWWIINSSVCLCGSAAGGRSGDWKVTLSSAQDLAVLFSPSHRCLTESLQKMSHGETWLFTLDWLFSGLKWNFERPGICIHMWIRFFACGNKTWQSEIMWNLLRHKWIPKCSPANDEKWCWCFIPRFTKKLHNVAVTALIFTCGWL